MALEIDELQVKITASANEATSALRSLSTALNNVKTQLTGVKNGVSVSQRLATHLHDMNSALHSLNSSGIFKLKELAEAMTLYADAVNRVNNTSGMSSVADSIKDIVGALSATNATAAAPASEMSDSWRDLIVGNTDALGQLGQAVTDLQDKIHGIDDTIGETKEHIKETNALFGKFVKSIARIALYRAIRSALKSITQAFSEGLKNAYAFSKQTEGFERLAETLDHIKSIVYQMTNQLGALVGEVIQFFLPAIRWLVEQVRKLAELATEFMAAMNGEDYYQKATYLEKTWDEATEAVKRYKHQLLGLDELNILSDSQTTGKKKDEDHSKDFELIPIRDSFKKIGNKWQELKNEFQKQFGEGSDWHNLLLVGIGGLVLGTALLLTGHFGIGLGLILGCGALAIYEAAQHWDELTKELSAGFEKVQPLLSLIGLGTMAVGLLLLFSGNIPWGLGLLIGGGFIAAASSDFSLDKLLENLKTAFDGIKTWFDETAMPWIRDKVAAIKKALNLEDDLPTNQKYEGALARSVRLNGGNYFGSELFEGEKPGLTSIPIKVADNSSATGAGSTGTLNGIPNELLPSGSIGMIKPGSPLDDLTPIQEAVSVIAKETKDIVVNSITENIQRGGLKFDESLIKANGGVIQPGSGSLFIAGEAGAEFVGNIGNTSAVANTGQMTDAIYKAAYMGMSKALKENGGGGMSGFEPATTDDLFIAMRKKANNYNKMTGSSAFA